MVHGPMVPWSYSPMVLWSYLWSHGRFQTVHLPRGVGIGRFEFEGRLRDLPGFIDTIVRYEEAVETEGDVRMKRAKSESLLKRAIGRGPQGGFAAGIVLVPVPGEGGRLHAAQF